MELSVEQAENDGESVENSMVARILQQITFWLPTCQL